MSGGASYVLSKEALRRFVMKGITNCPVRYRKPDKPEDVNLGFYLTLGDAQFYSFLPGNCMHQLNVTFGDSRDDKKLRRFNPRNPNDVFKKRIMDNITSCCSDTSISFHYISPQMMYVLHFLVYHLK